MPYKITKRFSFSASHQLKHLPEGHQCARLHGHNYEVEIELASFLTGEDGFVVDYGELKPLKDYLDGNLDHRHLNDVMGHIHPTAENLALWIFSIAKGFWSQTTAVRVSETPTTWAEFREAR